MGRERHPIPCVGSGNDPWAFSSTESWPKPGTGSMKPVKPWRNLAFEIITGIEDCNPSFGVEHGSSFEEMESVGMWQPKHGDTTATQLVVILGQTELIYCLWGSFASSCCRIAPHNAARQPFRFSFKQKQILTACPPLFASDCPMESFGILHRRRCYGLIRGSLRCAGWCLCATILDPCARADVFSILIFDGEVDAMIIIDLTVDA